MRSSLENMPLSLVMDMLEATASKHDLLLSNNLINFADDIWAQAQAHVHKTKQADNYMKGLIKQTQPESKNAWLEWVDSNSYGMKTLKGQSK